MKLLRYLTDIRLNTLGFNFSDLGLPHDKHASCRYDNFQHVILNGGISNCLELFAPALLLLNFLLFNLMRSELDTYTYITTYITTCQPNDFACSRPFLPLGPCPDTPAVRLVLFVLLSDTNNPSPQQLTTVC
jgi:hypothetical protein